MFFLVLLVVATRCEGQLKISQFPSTNIFNDGSYLLGIQDTDHAGHYANRRFQLPIQTDMSGNIEFITLAGNAGLMQVDGGGVPSVVPFDTLLVHHRRDSITEVSFTSGTGTVVVDLVWYVDSIARALVLVGLIDVQDPGALAAPPGRTAVNLITWTNGGVPQTYSFTQPVSSNNLIPMSGGGYFSDIDFRAYTEPLTTITHLKAYLVKPDVSIGEYSVFINVMIPIP